MEISSQNISTYHPVNAQAALRTDMQAQDRGPDSIPPANPSGNGAETSTSYDNSKTQGRYLDVEA